VNGWIKLHRQLCEHELWTCEPFSRGQAWVDLLLLANHEDGFFYLREHKINVRRGQVGWSILKLSQRWKWSRGKVTKYINDLEKEQQLKITQSNSTSIITIINYEQFQGKEQQVIQQGIQQCDNSTTIEHTTARQQDDTNKNDNNDKKLNNDKEETKKIHNTTPQKSAGVAGFNSNGLSHEQLPHCRIWYEFLYSGWVKKSNRIAGWNEFTKIYKATPKDKLEYVLCLIGWTNYHYREMYRTMTTEGYKRPNFDKYLKDGKYYDHEDSYTPENKDRVMKMFIDFENKNRGKYE
jgi:hypothetical protein